MVLALGMPEHIPNTQGHDIAGTAECKYRSALGVDESRLEFWLPHLSGLYNNEVPSTIEGSCSRVNFPASQCGVGPSMRRTVSVKSVFLLPPCEFLVFEPSRLCRHPSIRTLC